MIGIKGYSSNNFIFLYLVHSQIFPILHLDLRWFYISFQWELTGLILSHVHSTFACQSFHLLSPLPPLSSWDRLVVDRSMHSGHLHVSSRSCSNNCHEKKIGKDRDSNPRPLEWQASSLTARPCHSPRNLSCSTYRKKNKNNNKLFNFGHKRLKT